MNNDTPKGITLEDVRATAPPKLITKKVVLEVPIRNPKRHEWIRTLGGEQWRTLLYQLKIDEGERSEIFYIHPDLVGFVADDVRIVEVYTVYRKDGSYLLVPIVLPADSDEANWNTWSSSTRDGLEAGETQWVRMVPNMEHQCRDLIVAEVPLPEPKSFPCALDGSPVTCIAQLIPIALKQILITSLDHPVIKAVGGKRL
jgi:hypothetical protein